MGRDRAGSRDVWCGGRRRPSATTPSDPAICRRRCLALTLARSSCSGRRAKKPKHRDWSERAEGQDRTTRGSSGGHPHTWQAARGRSSRLQLWRRRLARIRCSYCAAERAEGSTFLRE